MAYINREGYLDRQTVFRLTSIMVRQIELLKMFTTLAPIGAGMSYDQWKLELDRISNLQNEAVGYLADAARNDERKKYGKS